ncbi:MAG: DUF885 domain-containing protein [Polyangia bacterium]
MARAFLLLCLLCGGVARADVATGLHRFFDAEWAWDMEDAPENATLLGDRTKDARLSDLSPAAFARRRTHLAERLRRARSFDARKLGQADRLSLELFVATTQTAVDMSRFPLERLAITQQGGPHIDLPTLAQVPSFRTPQHYADYVKRLQAIPAYIDQVIALLEAGRTSGWVSPKEPLRDVVSAVRAIETSRPEESVFYTPFRHPNADASSARQAVAIIAHDLVPAYEKLAVYLEKTYLPATRSDVGAWALPDGEAYYEACIHLHTTTKRSAADVHALGLAEVARIEHELEAAMRRTGYTGTREAFAQMLRTDPRFFFPSGATLLVGYRDIAKRIDGALPRLFGKLPRLPYGVEPTPANEEKTATTAYYRPGSPGDGRSGTFSATLYKPETRPKWEMEALTLHEAVPGHHLQIALAQELPDVPRFRQELMFTAFTEGWGLYAESLGPELGMFEDPYSKYGQLTYEMWRAIRLVVDTGMHDLHWTRQQAVDYFMAHTAKSRHDVEVEIDRYIVWPGQALAYKMGELELKRLRAYAQQTQGAKFDIRAFHDAVLSAGSIPLELLDRRVRAFVAAGR